MWLLGLRVLVHSTVTKYVCVPRTMTHLLARISDLVFLQNMGGTHNENDAAFENTSSRRLHRRITRRIQYALPVAEKPS